jgi:alpha-glucoside transport system permease protein
MTALDAPVLAPPRTFSERLMRIINKAPVHIALALVALIWLLPTVGLLITSVRPRSEIQASGWWTVFGGNIDFTIANYQAVLEQQSMLPAFINSVSIVVPSTILPLLIASMAASAISAGVSKSGSPTLSRMMSAPSRFRRDARV